MNAKSHPVWFRLMNYWQFDPDMKRSSLPFSLLVGAYDAYGFGFGSHNDVKTFSQALFNEMMTTEIDGFVPVDVPCPSIRRGVSLVSIVEASSYESLDFEELWARLGVGILDRKYSIDQKKAYYFDSFDLRWMSDALGLSPTKEYLAFLNSNNGG